MSDLNKLTNITITSADDGIKGQFIPKNIYHIRNLETLSLVNTQFSGNLPKELGQLSKVRALILNGNIFTGGIPESFAEIETLETLNLKSNKLTGKIPTSLTSLENLTKLNVSENDFIGELPYFNDAFAEISVAKNQLTINSEKIPSFLTGPNAYYEDTFIQGLQLTAKNAISIKGKDISMIKPFDEVDQGYFNLHALGEEEIPLVDGHTYTILNEATNEILYEGYWDKEQAIPYAKGIGYTVILDNAALNPNNQCIVKTKIPELKLETIPSALAFDIALGNDLKKPVEMIGALAVFDNRDEGNWKLGITPSLLESETKTLKGEYSYINSSGTETSIITDQKAFIEKGISDAENERIPVSDKWNGKRGLQYTMNGSNYLGNYKGSVTWTLEDVPTSN
nr:hypothetical protein [Enterococcus sp. DIV0212c]